MGIFDKLKRGKKEEKPKAEADVKAAKKSNEKKSDAKKEKTAEPAKAKAIGMAGAVLLRPMLTEKSFKMQQENKYSFVISNDANKHKVKNAIKELYGTAPLSVNISQQRPLKKYRWGREVGQTKRVKKAIVTMPKGTVLNLTE